MVVKPLNFKYKVGDIVRIGVYRYDHLHHEVYGLIETRFFHMIPRQGRVPCYKIYSDETIYTEKDILGLVPLDTMNPPEGPTPA